MVERNKKESSSSGSGSDSVAEEDPLGGWASLFPDLDQASAALEGEEQGSPGMPPAHPSPPLERSALPAPRQGKAALPKATPALVSDAGRGPMGNQEAVAGLEQSPEDSKPGGGKFEGQRLSGAFIPDVTERPPYAPGGYDPLPEHVPVIAAIFSAIAPGAGQVYNGEDTRGVQFGLRFMALRPWIASVRQARAQGERIRTYYAPRPIKGAFWRALRYVVLFWGVVIGVCICLVWLGQGIWATVQIKRHEAYQVEVSEVVSRGAVVVQNARVEAVTAVLKGLEEHDTRTDFVMSEEERGQRLFIIGYEYCRRGEHRLCSEIMGRVIALQGGSRSAFRLQTWASVQAQNPREREPLPDVGEVPTLADFEFELEREVLGLPPAKNRAVEDEETP